MALIVNIETSGKVCSVALFEDQSLIGLKELLTDKSHSSLLASLIRDLIDESGFNMSDLDAVGISKGPGSYTGLRIGTSAAKGLCYALEIPLISINTLKAMAYGIIKYNLDNAILCPMLDARRMEVYCLATDNLWNIYMDTGAVIVDENTFDDILSQRKVLFFGSGSSKIEKLYAGNKNAFFIRDVYPSSLNMGQLVFDKYKNKSFEDLAYFEPFYLKEFISKKPKARL